MNSRYEIIQTAKLYATGSQYYLNNVYPEIEQTEEDNYIITTLEDRLDLLALDFYGDSDFWWVIASANSLPGDSIYLQPGLQLRIPANLPDAVTAYKQTNILR